MKTLSQNANLSKEYKNHSIHATVVTHLNNKGFEARHIMATTGHKSEISIKNYSRRCPSNKRKQMFNALAENLVENDAKKPKIEIQTSEFAAPQEDQNFNLGLVELNTINQNDLSDIFQLDNDIESPDLLNIITQIEKENQQEVPKEETRNIDVAAPNTTKTVNVANIQNVTQKLPQNIVPNMIFPHSNVTINYHIHN